MKTFYLHFKKVSAVYAVCIFSFIQVGIPPVFATSSGCPEAEGGTRTIYLDTGTEKAYYPGKVPANSEGIGKATAGFLRVKEKSYQVRTRKRSYKINPLLDGEKGKVVLHFFILNAPDTRLTITSGGGAVYKLDRSNYPDYVNKSLVLEGEVQIEYEGVVAGSSNPGEAIEIRYLTGDQVFESCRSRPVAVWTSLIRPDSYATVDDIEYANERVAPICMAYFDANRRFVYGETGFCLNSTKAAAVVRYGYYPGQISFTHEKADRFDIDEQEGFNQDDLLKSARIVWILANADMSSGNKQIAAQQSIWKTLEKKVRYTHSSSSLEGRAQAAVPSLPSPPEPEFSLKATSDSAGVDNPISFKLQFNADQNVPLRLRLEIEGGTLAGSITGPAALNGNVLTFTRVPAEVTIPVSRSTAGTATVQATYEESNFWNVYNLEIYRACDQGIQNFIGLGRKEVSKPYRTASATWTKTTLPVVLQAFDAYVEGGNAVLSWVTSVETGFDRFLVERSRDGKVWQQVGEIEGKEAGGYVFTDKAPHSGLNYYRLAMQDLDGSVALSPVESVSFVRVEAPYPNPATDRLNFRAEDIRLVSVVSLSGITLLERSPVSGGIDVGSLTEGLYLAVVKYTDGTVSSHRFIVKR